MNKFFVKKTYPSSPEATEGYHFLCLFNKVDKKRAGDGSRAR